MPPQNVLLHGNDRLSIAVEQRLVLAGCPVSRLQWNPNDTSQLDPDSLDRASALIIAGDDDPGNVDLALTARRLRADLPIVIRLFDEALAAHIKETLKGVTILSMSALAAPALVEATVRAVATARQTGAPAQTRAPKSRSLPRGRLDRVLMLAIAGLIGILTAFTIFFANALDLSYIDSLYFVWTTITTVGYGDIALRDASSAAKIAGMVLMFSGAAFIAVLFGLFTDWVVSRRFDILRGRLMVRETGHVVIAGGGNIGFRVAESLRQEGHRIVMIECDADNKNVAALRSRGDHVILADATRNDTLQLANVGRASAVLCLTDSDAVNFQIALLVRAIAKDIPVIMRVVSPELSAHVSEHGDAVAVSPIAIASAAFVAAVLPRAL
jgi:voltage-gated potassium channel Kch